jgi:hypothetical protein
MSAVCDSFNIFAAILQYLQTDFPIGHMRRHFVMTGKTQHIKCPAGYPFYCYYHHYYYYCCYYHYYYCYYHYYYYYNALLTV